MAATTGTAFLGLTVGCARCHDHKFDPIPTADYYRLVATFTTTVRSEIDLDLDPEADSERPWPTTKRPRGRCLQARPGSRFESGYSSPPASSAG